MKIKSLFLVTFLLGAFSLSAQTLFTYGPYKVDARDFLRAFNKNNTGDVKNRSVAIRSYLDLYIKSRLKIREALDRQLDTFPQMKAELVNLRAQITENFMTDPELTDRMVTEAFQRSQKDIHAAHLFISFLDKNGFIDSVAAMRKRDEVVQRLKKGEDFGKLARELSDDTTARVNNGDLGFITVFSLPYEFETAIYNTPIGKYSDPVRSRGGYHIFKKMGERKAVGKIRAQQILLSIPPQADESTRKDLAARADSLYKRIMAGDNFMKLAMEFSNDYVSAASGGNLPEIGVGQYDPVFEKVLWSLPSDGAVSKPFLTSYGWHIVKRNVLRPVVTDPKNKEYQQELKQKVNNDSRARNSRGFIYRVVTEKKGFKKFPYDDAALWNMSDSLLDSKPMTTGRVIMATTPLFAIGDSVYNANHWINYANTYRYKQDGSGVKPWDQVRDEWIRYSMEEYYKDHLEEFNEEFRYQMAEFREGNLFFEIMQQEVWGRSQTDTIQLMALYEKNKAGYLWKNSADAVVFFCADMNAANSVYEDLKKDPANWRKITGALPEKVIPDSARYEWDQIPNLNKMLPRPGMLTSPLINPTDNTVSFAYIFRVYENPTPRSFPEARGLVITDYQAVLEKEWDEALRKKYPVTVDEKVLASILK
ncbi:MAG: peptidylprolyl isomerase [Chitinophagaceae bacterium]